MIKINRLTLKIKLEDKWGDINEYDAYIRKNGDDAILIAFDEGELPNVSMALFTAMSDQWGTADIATSGNDSICVYNITRNFPEEEFVAQELADVQSSIGYYQRRIDSWIPGEIERAKLKIAELSGERDRLQDRLNLSEVNNE